MQLARGVLWSLNGISLDSRDQFSGSPLCCTLRREGRTVGRTPSLHEVNDHRSNTNTILKLSRQSEESVEYNWSTIIMLLLARVGEDITVVVD
jgi:hypothetical protein